MTDRELLEAAAKAAGINLHVVGDGNGGAGFYTYPEMLFWNPLIDDGDALRLAVKLQLQLDLRNPETHVFGPPSGRIDEYHAAGDPYAATRRCIVRAAAAMAG